MRVMVEELKERIANIEKERGSFVVKCLVANDASDINWDVVLSATWFEADEMARLRYLCDRIMSDLSVDAISQLNGLTTFDPKDYFIIWLQGVKELNGSNPHLFLDEVKVVSSESPRAKLIVFL